MRFTKMHGLGNDFVFLVPAQVGDHDWPTLARGMCDRHFGVGADGLILVLPSGTADFRMRMFNPDGSEAEMCGNGIRCFGKYLLDNGFWSRPEVTVDTAAGLQRLLVHTVAGRTESVQVDMGQPVLARGAETLHVTAAGREFDLTLVSMGNPHAVAFLDSPVDEYPLDTVGPAVERHPAFPNRTNFEIVNVVSDSEIRVRVWERGAGLTLACGTGACAAAVASRLHGHTGESVTVHLPGGDLRVAWQGEGQPVIMTGPATTVFTGDWLL